MLISSMEVNLINTVTCSTPNLIHALTNASMPIRIHTSTPTLIQAHMPSLVPDSTPTFIQASMPTIVPASNPTLIHTSTLTQEYISASAKPQVEESQNDEVDVLECSERNVASSTSCIRGDAHATCSPDVDGGWAWVVAVAAFIQFCISSAVGTSLNFSGWIVGLTRFWKRRHALAVGIIMSGSGFGVFFLGPVMEIIVHEYGWRGAMLICAGMSFNFSVCGATIYSRLRQPTLERGFCKENKLLMVVANDMEKAVASCDSDINDTSEESFHSNDIFESEAHLETKTLTETLAVQPPVAIGSVWSLAHHHPQNQQCQHLHDWKSSMKRRIRDKTSPKNQCTGTEVITMRQLLRSPTFWLLEASCFFSFMATTTVYAVFLDWTVWSGLAVAFSAALSGSGAGDILGRMLAGFIMGQGLPPLILFSGIQFLLSVTIGCASISSAPWQLVAAMVGMGVACGLQSVLYALMPSQLTSGARVGHVLGYLLFVTGAGALSGPPIAGFIVDKMESYAPVLILCTAAPAAAALLNYIAHCTSRSLTSPVPQTLTCNSNK
ncbi:monocarboxylate transporter 12 isoform X2 [Procambarus clarkii]|uniref:monocarboxylate transporter 12 isoform X2 n=1 Tax=Procambarus clarkii TaxID=6728 RepID=UPI001E6770B6|nr:monocarboxylate transporter 7-like isoform X3 [Procambarus clarkii]